MKSSDSDIDDQFAPMVPMAPMTPMIPMSPMDQMAPMAPFMDLMSESNENESQKGNRTPSIKSSNQLKQNSSSQIFELPQIPMADFSVHLPLESNENLIFRKETLSATSSKKSKNQLGQNSSSPKIGLPQIPMSEYLVNISSSSDENQIPARDSFSQGSQNKKSNKVSDSEKLFQDEDEDYLIDNLSLPEENQKILDFLMNGADDYDIKEYEINDEYFYKDDKKSNSSHGNKSHDSKEIDINYAMLDNRSSLELYPMDSSFKINIEKIKSSSLSDSSESKRGKLDSSHDSEYENLLNEEHFNDNEFLDKKSNLKIAEFGFLNPLEIKIDSDHSSSDSDKNDELNVRSRISDRPDKSKGSNRSKKSGKSSRSNRSKRSNRSNKSKNSDMDHKAHLFDKSDEADKLNKNEELIIINAPVSEINADILRPSFDEPKHYLHSSPHASVKSFKKDDLSVKKDDENVPVVRYIKPDNSLTLQADIKIQNDSSGKPNLSIIEQKNISNLEVNEKIEQKGISTPQNEYIKFIEDENYLIEDLDIPEPFEKSSASNPANRQKTLENIQIDPLSINFWQKTTKWSKRKKIAIKSLKNPSNLTGNNFHDLAYQGRLYSLQSSIEEQKKISKSFEDNKNPQKNQVRPSIQTLLSENSLGLTPLIYAIWGEQDRNDENKQTSKWIFGTAYEEYKSKLGKNYQNFKKDRLYFDPLLKNELGHAIIHKIITQEENYGIFELIIGDYVNSVSFIIECMEKFELIDEVYLHPVCNSGERTSIAAFALRLKSVQCVDLFFDEILKSIIRGDYSYMIPIIEKEISDFISYNSTIIEKLLKGFFKSREKSLLVNIERIPELAMVSCTPQEIAKFSYNYFDNMPNSKNYIKCQIVNSIISLPCVTGSTKSLNFFQNLASNDNMMIFKVPLIKSYLEYKWDRIWLIILFQSILMWTNVPLIVFLVFIDKYNTEVLYGFVAVNGFLSLFEIFKLISMGFFKYMGNVDKNYIFMGFRVLALGMVFYPDIQIINYFAYILLSSLFIVERIEFLNCVKWIFYYCFITALIFPGFWAGWDQVWYLIMSIGVVSIPAKLCLHSRINLYSDLSFRFSVIAVLVIILVTGKRDFGVMMTCLFIMVHISLVKFLVYLKRKDTSCIHFFLEFLIAATFTLNFYLQGSFLFYSVIIIILAFHLIKIMVNQELKNLKRRSADIVIFHFSFFTLFLIGFDFDDSYILKIIIISWEVLFLFIFRGLRFITFTGLKTNFIDFFFNWNFIDLIRMGICAAWLEFEFTEETNLALTYAMVTLVLVRGLIGFRCFKQTRYYIRLIFNSILEVLPFILIFFYSTFSFGIICSIYRNSSLSELWMYTYDLNIGIISHPDNFDMNYLSFLVATMINVIIMLNLLISILGESFDRFQVSATEIDFMEMTQTLLEIETILFWRRSKIDPGKYLIGIFDDSREEKQKGKITRNEFLELKDEIEKVGDGLDKKFNFIEKRMTDVYEIGEKKMIDHVANAEKKMKMVFDIRIDQREKRIAGALMRMIKK